MKTVLLLIIWTWGITPTWVNIVVSIIAGLSILGDIIGVLND